MIGNDGIFEGRGWDVSPEYPEGDRGFLSIGFLSNNFLPEPLIRATLSELKKDGIIIGKLAVNVEFICELCEFLNPNPTSTDTSTTLNPDETSTKNPETTTLDPETTTFDPDTAPTLNPDETSTIDPETTTLDPETTTVDPDTESTVDPDETSTIPMTIPPLEPDFTDSTIIPTPPSIPTFPPEWPTINSYFA